MAKNLIPFVVLSYQQGLSSSLLFQQATEAKSKPNETWLDYHTFLTTAQQQIFTSVFISNLEKFDSRNLIPAIFSLKTRQIENGGEKKAFRIRNIAFGGEKDVNFKFQSLKYFTANEPDIFFTSNGENAK